MSGAVNAMEGGNLGITLAEKFKLMKSGYRQVEIVTRLVSRDYRDRFAAEVAQRNGDNFSIAIRDQGLAFDWKGHLASEECSS